MKLILAATALAAAPAMAADPAHPTVIEPFESQGCSDCPPAYKYDPTGPTAMFAASGWTVERQWISEAPGYGLFLLGW